MDHTDLEGLVVVAAQHVLDRGDINRRVFLRTLFSPRAYKQRGATVTGYIGVSRSLTTDQQSTHLELLIFLKILTVFSDETKF